MESLGLCHRLCRNMPELTVIDMLQIHWPVTEPQKKGDRIDPSVKETWTAMEKLVDEVSSSALC